MSKFKRTPLYVALTLAMCGTMPAHAQVQNDSELFLEEVITIGSRSAKPRSATDSPVPVDVIGSEQFNSLGNSADITDNLKTLVLSFTATPANGDGSAFVRPTSLRGTAPDQTLVLVNGKRRHRSALVHFFAPAAGNGAHGPDIGMIPSIALQNVEILRDGAAAQYGSDAIAGVINFQTKNASEGGEALVQYGQFFEGEENIKVAGNIGLPLFEKGFLNLSGEYIDNEALSRGKQRPDAQALIDAGVPGVGADSPFGDAPLTQSWGRPETSGVRLFVNSGVNISDSAQVYLHGNYAQTDGRYRFFYRPAANPNDPSSSDHSTIAALRALGFQGLQQGYTPFLDGDQTDLSLVGGIKGEFANQMIYDFSVGYGNNTLDYFLYNSTNPDLGVTADNLLPQQDFDVGGYEQEEININADFSKAITADLNLAFGFEWREETYIVVAGDPNASIGGGSSGFKGIRAQDAGEFARDNYAVYVDMEQDISNEWLVQYALRYEEFSDFGSTVNGKLATRYRVSNNLTLRGALSTGFHAPTPGQANVRTTITTFDGSTGLQIEEGLLPSTSPLARSVGGTDLKEEESVNVSFGLSADLTDSTVVTVDFYRIEVDDRIYRTGDIQVPGPANSTVSFYTNALDVEHEGVDIVLTSSVEWGGPMQTDFSFAFSYNEIDVVSQTAVNTPAGPVNPVSDANIEDIENNYPNERFTLAANTWLNEQMNFLVRANYYGEHYDERGTINDPVLPSAELSSTIFVDMELGYNIDENYRVTIGGTNVFDEYVDEIGQNNANRQSVGLPYPRRSAANYEGGSWYLRLNYSY